MSFQEKSYKKHFEHFRQYSEGNKNASHAKQWLKDDTVDAWRHQRMYQILDPLLQLSPDKKWLTVGDGRYGKDAHYIYKKGIEVLASDISDFLLKEAKESGYISNYSKENAESLSFEDGEFDYVFCKESYHHFPRPMIALYEMLRVANMGVVLIEPNDEFISENFWGAFVQKIRWLKNSLFGRKLNKHSFEVSGNYKYDISQREIEKVALGLNYRLVAFKGINDGYISGIESEKLSDNGPLKVRLDKLLNKGDFLSKLGIKSYDLLAAIIFKLEPSEDLLQTLKKAGFEIRVLPENPYIS